MDGEASPDALKIMDGVPDGTTDETAEKKSHADETERPTPLRGIVVRYESGPDRCTLVPDESDGALLSVWLTADLDAFVDLEERR